MRILLIGGTGMISTAIARKLLAQGDEVVLLNRGSSVVDGLDGLDGARGSTARGVSPLIVMTNPLSSRK